MEQRNQQPPGGQQSFPQTNQQEKQLITILGVQGLSYQNYSVVELKIVLQIIKQVPKVLLDSASMSAMLLYIITNAVLFSFLMTSENIPQSMAAWLLDMGLGPISFLLMVNILLLLAGNVMEPSSIVLIFAPILFPVAQSLGIDPVHFGILITVNMEVGMCHPPVGLNLYVASGITKMGITELTKAVWPWLLTMIVFLGIVTYIPAVSLWLPRTLGMM
jgi:C4-dicarboxylate transporter DctM subunit